MEAAGTLYTLNHGLESRAKEYMDNNRMTITEMANAIGYSRTAVSQFLAGKYNSKNSDLEKAVESFLQQHSAGEGETSGGIQNLAVKPAFFESKDAVNIIGVCHASQEFMGLGIVVGKSGYGKTHTLKYYAKMPRVAYVECDDTMGQRDLVKAIERSIGLPTGYGSIWERVNSIRDFFNTNRGYLLIVDEADKLVSKYTQKKMEILRGIFDQADVGLVIAGEPKLESQIKGYLSRFANRVDFYTTLRGLSAEEVQSYLQSFQLDQSALQEMIVRATNQQTGCFRLLDRTLNNVLRVAQGTDITARTISKASSMMML